jgi:phage tail tape-measure protein
MGGAAAGAGGGALAGSIVPVLGTTVGAAVGGVLGGVAAWIGTDYALLALDEAISREGFEAEILLAIDEAEAEFLSSLGPSH